MVDDDKGKLLSLFNWIFTCNLSCDWMTRDRFILDLQGFLRVIYKAARYKGNNITVSLSTTAEYKPLPNATIFVLFPVDPQTITL